MSLHAYCQKRSDAEQNVHCSTKCFACVIEICKTQAIWKEKYQNTSKWYKL